jgi:hypothetical protein
MKVIVSKGPGKIILGNFYEDNGSLFESAFPCSADSLSAQVVEGKAWSDIPASTACSLVVSDATKSVLDTFAGCKQLPFIRTTVREFPHTCFWTLSDTLGVWDEALEPVPVLSTPTRLVAGFTAAGRDLIVDESMWIF